MLCVFFIVMGDIAIIDVNRRGYHPVYVIPIIRA